MIHIGIVAPGRFPGFVRNSDLLQNVQLGRVPEFSKKPVRVSSRGVVAGNALTLLPLAIARSAQAIGRRIDTDVPALISSLIGWTVVLPNELARTDLLFGHGLYPAQLGRKKPVITSLGYLPDDYRADMGLNPDRSTEIETLRKRCLGCDGIFLSTTEAIARFNLEVAAMPAERVWRLPCFQPTLPRASSPAPSPRSAHKQLTILFVGMQARRKNLPSVIAAIDELHDEMRGDLRLIVVSDLRDGPVDLQRPYIEHHNSLRNSEVLELMASAEILCMPSLAESFGMVFIEAIASGCAVVAPDRTTQHSMLGDAVEYADPADRQSILDALRRLASPSFRKELTERAYDRFRQMFAPDVVATEIVQAAETILDSATNA